MYSFWFILPNYSPERSLIAWIWIWIPALLLTSRVSQPLDASVSSPAKWLHKYHEDKRVCWCKIPGTVAGHGTVLYKIATYSMVLQQHGTISTSLLLESPYKEVCLYSHGHVMVRFSIWQDWPCGHVSLHPGLGEVGKRSAMWCHIVISLNMNSRDLSHVDRRRLCCCRPQCDWMRKFLAQGSLINLKPMFHLGNRTGFLQPYNSHFHL